MLGINVTKAQANGVTTTFATVLDIRWQPSKSADIQIGYFVSEAAFVAGESAVVCEYFPLNISLIDPTLAIPPQLFSQLTASGNPLEGGTLV